MRIQQVTDEIAESLNLKPARGALVAGVDDKGPAKPAGIEAGDVIVKFDGKDIKEMRDLPRIVADTPVGKDVEVVVIRKGKEEKKTVQARPARGRREAGSGCRQAEAGRPRKNRSCRRRSACSFRNMTDELRKKYKIKDTVKGVVITGVDANSAGRRQAARRRRRDRRDRAGARWRAPADVQTKVDQLKKDGTKTALLLVAERRRRTAVRGAEIAVDRLHVTPGAQAGRPALGDPARG